ncbi:MAG TPA: DUF4198 domain-containing protein [Thermoanaerobaculia bacterium]
MRTICAAALLLLATNAFAHDFWIEPSTFRPPVGQTVMLALRVGQDFMGDPVPRSSELIDSFVVRTSAGESTIAGYEHQDPAGLLRIERNGVAVVAYRSKANFVELPPAKFAEFLKLEGITWIGAIDKPDREHFFRYAKTLLRTGASTSMPVAHVPGFRYDIVPESSPWSSEPLRVRVVFEDKAARDVLVTAIHRDDPNARVAVRTDAHGRATLHLPKGGVWLVKSVYMVPAPAGSGVDWESLWASVTFER